MQLLWDRNIFIYVIQLGLEPLWSSRGDGFEVLNSTPLWVFLYGIAYILLKGTKPFFCVIFNKVGSVCSFNHLTWVTLLELISPGKKSKKPLQRNHVYSAEARQVWLDILVLLSIEITEPETTSSLVLISAVLGLLTLRTQLPLSWEKKIWEFLYTHIFILLFHHFSQVFF